MSLAKHKIPLRRRLAYLLLVYLVFLLVLFAIEVATRVLMPPVSSLQLFVTTTQQKQQVATDAQSTIFEGDPLLLWRLKPNLDHAIWDFTVVTTNAQHFRADHPIHRKTPETFRILCLGDSVTFGFRVPVVWPNKPTEYDPESLPFPLLLEKLLQSANSGREIEVIDMAVPGYTSHQGLAWLRRDIANLQPDLLIASFGWNDASLSDAPDNETINTAWYAVGVRWLVHHSQTFAHATRRLRSGKKQEGTPPRRPVPRVSAQEYVNNMRDIVRLAGDHQARVIVMAAPYRDSVTNPPEGRLMTQYRDALRSAMVNDKIAFLEIPELTETAYPANDGWFGELIHPNDMGHRLIASELLRLLRTNELLNDLNLPELIP